MTMYESKEGSEARSEFERLLGYPLQRNNWGRFYDEHWEKSFSQWWQYKTRPTEKANV